MKKVYFSLNYKFSKKLTSFFQKNRELKKTLSFSRKLHRLFLKWKKFGETHQGELHSRCPKQLLSVKKTSKILNIDIDFHQSLKIDCLQSMSSHPIKF